MKQLRSSLQLLKTHQEEIRRMAKETFDLEEQGHNPVTDGTFPEPLPLHQEQIQRISTVELDPQEQIQNPVTDDTEFEPDARQIDLFEWTLTDDDTRGNFLWENPFDFHPFETT
jgi:hypothetical protein